MITINVTQIHPTVRCGMFPSAPRAERSRGQRPPSPRRHGPGCRRGVEQRWQCHDATRARARSRLPQLVSKIINTKIAITTENAGQPSTEPDAEQAFVALRQSAHLPRRLRGEIAQLDLDPDDRQPAQSRPAHTAPATPRSTSGRAKIRPDTAIPAPVIGCTTTAVAVNRVSAITTIRAVAAIVVASCVRWAMNMKNAMPSPVPNSTARRECGSV